VARRFVWPVSEYLEESRPVKAPEGITVATIFQFLPRASGESPMKSMSFAVFPVVFHPFILCNPIAQTRLNYLPCWCRMRKSSANFIWCITYTTEGKICGKMAGMNIVASGCHSCRHHQSGFASGIANCFLTGVENQGRRFKTLREKSFPGRTGKWRRFCKVCKCGPPLSARVPRHDENNFRPSVAGRSENTNGFGSFSSECRSFILCNHCTKAGNISGKMAAMKVMARSRCPCRHRRP